MVEGARRGRWRRPGWAFREMSAAGSSAQTPVTHEQARPPRPEAGPIPPFDGNPPAARRKRIGMSTRPLGAHPFGPGSVFARADFASTRLEDRFAPLQGCAPQRRRVAWRGDQRRNSSRDLAAPLPSRRSRSPEASPSRLRIGARTRIRHVAGVHMSVPERHSVEHAAGRKANFHRLGSMPDEIMSRAPRGGRDWTRPRSASQGRSG